MDQGGSCPNFTYTLENDPSGAASLDGSVLTYEPNFETPATTTLGLTVTFDDILDGPDSASPPLEIAHTDLEFIINNECLNADVKWHEAFYDRYSDFFEATPQTVS